MTRKKVRLEWIHNDCARRASLKKRRLGLLKKVSELTTLCDIKACLIIYSPDEEEPMVWPSHPEVHRQLGAFYQLPELDRLKKMTNQETYLKERVAKAQEQLRKTEKRNKEFQIGYLLHQVDQGKGLCELSLGELHGLIWLVEDKMKEIGKRIDFYEHFEFEAPAGQPHGDLPPQGPADDLKARIRSSSAGFGGDNGKTTIDSVQWDEWFINMINSEPKYVANYNSSIRGDMGLPCQPFAGITAEELGLRGHSFGGSSSVATDMGLPQFGNFISPTADVELPPLSSTLPGGATEMGPPHGTVGGSTFGSFGSDIGLGLNPFEHIGSSSAGGDLGMPFGPFGGASSSVAGTDIGLPFDGNTLSKNIAP
ncbi:hypothetical protein DITRI_Ditri06bG0034500 [Diplodiscus trichospermus]